MLERQNEMAAFKKNKLELEAQKNWIRFYESIELLPRPALDEGNELADVFDDVDLNQELVFLEAGAGVGNMLFPLTTYFPNWRFFAFDFAPNAVEAIRKRAEEMKVEVGTKVVDLTAPPAPTDEQPEFPPGRLGDKHALAVRNLAAFVRPGGSVFVRDYGALDYAMVRFGWKAKIADRFYARQDSTRAFYFYVEELRELFEANGFECTRCEYLHRKTTNHEKGLSVDRVFVQGRFKRRSPTGSSPLRPSIRMSPTSDSGPSWLFELHEIENTPSRRAGISDADEEKARKDSVMMIYELSRELKLAIHGPGASACVYFHRFYMFHSMREYPTRIAVLGCLFLAGKVEETPKKCKDLVAAAQSKFPDVYANATPQDVMNFEKVLLHTLRFDLQVEQPYNHLIEYLKIFHIEDREIKREVGTKAWTFINDSYSTTLCLMWYPEIIAMAMLQMALSMVKGLPQPLNYTNSHKYANWWDHFVSGLNPDVLEIIKQILLKYYQTAESEPSTSNAWLRTFPIVYVCFFLLFWPTSTAYCTGIIVYAINYFDPNRFRSTVCTKESLQVVVDDLLDHLAEAGALLADGPVGDGREVGGEVAELAVELQGAQVVEGALGDHELPLLAGLRRHHAEELLQCGDERDEAGGGLAL
ncbi:hypothetical protein M3Y99_00734100 [Aphelenchoides fujianensis]|nr:hypothetical protein M3Y99_00734100 [Aphelenchoides fujianensis]